MNKVGIMSMKQNEYNDVSKDSLTADTLRTFTIDFPQNPTNPEVRTFQEELVRHMGLRTRDSTSRCLDTNNNPEKKYSVLNG